jgi:putative GTP pyrophosphokinase
MLTLKEQIEKRLIARFPLYKTTEKEVLFILKSALRKAEIKIHSFPSRIKTPNSILKKAESNDLTTVERCFSEINDIIGIRIICLFLSDIKAISDVIKENFEVLDEDDKITNRSLSDFAYLSSHFLCKIKKEFTGPRYESIKHCVFEIQVRTITMDAWANMSHHLDYKSDIEIPKDLKKDFFALNGLLYVADTHFEMFYKSKKEQSVLAIKNLSQTNSLDINFETIEAYINDKFPERSKAQPSGISELTQELLHAGFKTIHDLDKKINDGLSKNIPTKWHGWNRVGRLRELLKEGDENYKNIREEKDRIVKERIAANRDKKPRLNLNSTKDLPPLGDLPAL